MNDMVEVLNLETGARGKVRRSILEHEYFNPGILVEVDPTQKPYEPEMYKSRLTEPAVDPVTVEDPAPDEEPESDSEEEED